MLLMNTHAQNLRLISLTTRICLLQVPDMLGMIALASALTVGVNRTNTVSIKLSISCSSDGDQLSGSRCALHNIPSSTHTFDWADENDPICLPLGTSLDANIIKWEGPADAAYLVHHWCVSDKSTIDVQDNLILYYGGGDVAGSPDPDNCYKIGDKKRSVLAIGDCVSDTQGQYKTDHWKLCYQGLCA
jgi:hypothetical protein